MYRLLGKFVMRLWPAILVGWFVALGALMLTKPKWDDVVEQGEFAFLPSRMPSIQAEKLYEETWGEPQAARIVVIARRDDMKLTEADREFISNDLRKGIEAAIEELGLPEPQKKANVAKDAEPVETETTTASKHIKTFASPSFQKVLDSKDGTATMVLVNMKTEFFDARNSPLIDRIEKLINPDDPSSFYKQRNGNDPVVPRGLHLALSGDATVGRDMMRAAVESSKATELWTTLLVVVLLLLIYRAPVLALIPLVTVGIATEFSLALLSHLAKHEALGLFNGIEVYVKVLSYGAGVDYCLFLIARFKEELDDGLNPQEAVGSSISKVGHALVASAGTVICGIFMMTFAEFGKFRQAGAAITIGLIVVLFASMTFTPALLRLAGRWAFWPHMASSHLGKAGGWVSATGLMASLFRRNVFESIWQKTSDLIVKRPLFVLLVSFAVMLPFAVLAGIYRSHLSYGLLSELPQDNASVRGAKAIQGHYAEGTAGPVTILLRSPKVELSGPKGEPVEGEERLDFDSDQGRDALKSLTESLYELRNELQLADVRSLSYPFGIADDGVGADPYKGMSIIEAKIADRILRAEVKKVYLGRVGNDANHVTRLDLVSVDDPFSRGSMSRFDNLIETVRAQAQKNLKQNIEVHAIGPTASLKDLKTTTDRDAIVVDALVLLGVFGILVWLLGQFTVSVYLIVSVLFSYLVTLGVTFAFFWALDPSGFAGLDWKVPTFLFTILIAVGEDYNIFLMTRIQEEQVIHGRILGVPIALTKTGSIISSCGIIMAGTFCSLMAGTLVGMHQLGFALAFGVLLDTFVVRPILVPAFLILLYDGRFKSLKSLIGAAAVTRTAPTEEQPGIEPRVEG